MFRIYKGIAYMEHIGAYIEAIGAVDRKKLFKPNGVYENQLFKEIFLRICSLTM